MEQKYEKDYSLLRQFDLEAAKRGEAICDNLGNGCIKKFLDGTDEYGMVVGWSQDGHLGMWDADYLRMAPLAWVEGKPVYKGDRLWWKPQSRLITVKNYNPAEDSAEGGVFHSEESGCYGAWLSKLTWTPPKVKREVKLLAYLDADQLFWLRETAQPKWPAVRVTSEDKVVEVEE